MVEIAPLAFALGNWMIPHGMGLQTEWEGRLMVLAIKCDSARRMSTIAAWMTPPKLLEHPLEEDRR